MSTIFFVAGSKGGVGKSIAALALVDYLKEQGSDPIVVESDTSNPDVGKSLEGTDTPWVSLNLDVNAGWVDLSDLCGNNPEADIVVNTAARNHEGLESYAELLFESLKETKHHLVTFWVINRLGDSLELLERYRHIVTVGDLHVIRNTYFGKTDTFTRYEDSKVRKNIEAAGGLTLDLSELGSRVVDHMNEHRLDVGRAAKEMSLGHRSELARWRRANAQMFDRALKKDNPKKFIAKGAAAQE